jgi:GntR family transcriptional regulator/MocR family aminotransferase
LLAKELSVSRNTVLAAFEQLVSEAYLVSRAGAGTFVAGELPDRAMAVQSGSATKPSANARPPLAALGQRLAESRVQWPPPSKPGAAFRLLPEFDRQAFETWSQISRRVWKQEAARMLRYGEPEGHKRLRDEIASYLVTSRGVKCSATQILIVDGSQQALDLTVRLLLNPGDAAWMEDPGYIGARAALDAGAANTIPVPIDADGIDIAEGIRRHPRPRLIYVTPSHQWPLGPVMSVERRHQLLELASRVGAWIIEDDYDSEFRYSGRPVPALQGMDADGRVIYIGTFSKVLFPSLRLGYIVVPEELIDAFVSARLVTGLHSPTLSQAVLAEFIAKGHFVRHLRRMRKLYAERQRILAKAAAEELEGLLRIEESPAGMQLLAWLPPGANDKKAAECAANEGVNTIPLSLCYIKPPPAPALILGYTGLRPPLIWKGVRNLGIALRKTRHIWDAPVPRKRAR